MFELLLGTKGVASSPPVDGFAHIFGASSTFRKYSYTEETTVAGNTFTGGSRSFGAGAGNHTYGVVGGAQGAQAGATTTVKETYATETCATGTSFGTRNHGWPAASGNDTFGQWSGGFDNSSTVFNYIDRYTYATDVRAATTNLTGVRWAATGLSTLAVGYTFCGSAAANSTSVVSSAIRYTYDSSAVAAGTALGNARRFPGSAGNATMGVIQGGDSGNFTATAVVELYQYSGEVRTTGSALSTAIYGRAGTGHAYKGFFFGAYSGSALVDKYEYANNTRTSGTALSTGNESYPALLSTSPGAF